MTEWKPETLYDIIADWWGDAERTISSRKSKCLCGV